MDSSFDESTENSSRRFSSENWKILNSFKQHREELMAYQNRSSLEHLNQGSDCECLSDCDSNDSCCHEASSKYSFENEETGTKYESCLNTARSSLPVIHQELETCEENEQMLLQRPLESIPYWIEERTKSLERNIMTIFNNRDNDYVKLHEIPSTRNEAAPVSSKGSGRSPSIDNDSKVTATISSLLAIEPLKKFFRGIVYHEPSEEDAQHMVTKSTLQLFLKTFKRTRRKNNLEHLQEIQRLIEEISQEEDPMEPCFETLKNILGKLHEEIILAKKDGNLKRTCLRRCRQSNRSNHSIVSHIFRGHLKKRAECPCGHNNISREPFTSIHLSFSNLDEKTLVLPVTSHSRINPFTTTRYLLRFNQWTTVNDIKSKLSKIDGYQASQLVFASVKFQDIHIIHDSSTTVFDAICEEGEIQAFEVYEKEKESKVKNKQVVNEEEDDFPFTSTPAITDASDNGEDYDINSARREKHNKYETVRVPVVFKNDSDDSNGKNQFPPTFLSLPRIIGGRQIARILAKILSITESESSRIVATALKTEDELCLVCCDSICHGCYLRSNRSVALDEGCKIAVHMPPNLKLKKPEIVEHTTLTSGIPANVYTIEEGLAAFRNEESITACSACGINQHLQTTRIVANYPDILVLTMDRDSTSNKDFVITVSGFSPALSKTNKNKKRYDLSGMIVCTKESNSSVKTIYKSAAEEVENQKLPHKNIQILIYANNQYDEKNRVKRVSSSAVAKRAWKKKEQLIDASRNEPHPLSRQSSIASCSSAGSTTCDCSRCYCWEKCAEQIRGSSSSTMEKLKLEEDLQTLKETLSPNPNLTIQLQRAVLKQDLRRIISLLKKGANPDELVDGKAAIHIAAGFGGQAGHIFTKLFLDHGADVHVKSDLGQTPIQFAALWDRSETIKLLCSYGANLAEAKKVDNIRSSKSATPLARSHADLSRDTPSRIRHDEDNLECSPEDDPYLQTMMRLQKSLALDHLVFDSPMSPSDNMESLRRQSVKAVQERLFAKQQEIKKGEEERERDADLDKQLAVCLEAEKELQMSELSQDLNETYDLPESHHENSDVSHGSRESNHKTPDSSCRNLERPSTQLPCSESRAVCEGTNLSPLPQDESISSQGSRTRAKKSHRTRSGHSSSCSERSDPSNISRGKSDLSMKGHEMSKVSQGSRTGVTKSHRTRSSQTSGCSARSDPSNISRGKSNPSVTSCEDIKLSQVRIDIVSDGLDQTDNAQKSMKPSNGRRRISDSSDTSSENPIQLNGSDIPSQVPSSIYLGFEEDDFSMEYAPKSYFKTTGSWRSYLCCGGDKRVTKKTHRKTSRQSGGRMFFRMMWGRFTDRWNVSTE